jgi:hypothetical protein
MLSDENQPRAAGRMAAALRELRRQPRPSEVFVPGLLGGLDRIRNRFGAFLAHARSGISMMEEAAE